MNIREATSEDNDELQTLQARCPMGTTLVVSTVNTPDFFARAKAYESYKVFVVCEDDQIIGSSACAIRNALVNGKLGRIGYSFQAFISPDRRRKHLAKQLLQHTEDHFVQNGAAFVYALIMEGNLPSMKLVESLGFRLLRTLIMPVLTVYREMDIASTGHVRQAASKDLGLIAELLNDTWQGYDLYEPTSAEALTRFVNRTPGYSFENLFVFEDRGEILACLGFWDWRQIMRIIVIERSLKMRIIGLMLDMIRNFRPMPRGPKAGDTLRQVMLTPIAFKDPQHMAVLLRYMNNQALQREIKQIFCVCERGHALFRSLKGFIHVDTAMHLYIKSLQQSVSIGDRPVFIDGIDL